ncbi:MAG TPA: hypothetical protein VG838_12590 [Opitutaceae bacterium]|nr:hypothetical protein [Opitutaceae bacterium]HWA10283.1 hypothetical protein [Opitutaceae bacterium]
MKTSLFTLLLAALLAAGCSSSPSSRIDRNRAEFDRWPIEVQQKVAAGQVDVGFTTDQVRMALGDPDRIATRTTAETETEAWIYRDRGPRIGFGLGVGSFGGGTAVGVGLHSGDWALRPDESKRVVFDGGKVSAVEMSARGR